MVAYTKEFAPILPPQERRPLSRSSTPGDGFSTVFRDQFSITTWLCLGAVTQGLLWLAVGRRLAFLPAVGVLVFRVLDTFAMTMGWKRNKYMDGVILKKFASSIPDVDGRYGPKPADKSIVVFLIGARSNHPLGFLAPGFKEMGDYFSRMTKSLEEHADEYGFLGMSPWQGSDRATGNTVMQIAYFKSLDGLHAFAHGKLHRDGWDWWLKTEHEHLSIWHETYNVPKGNWDSIYLNSHAGGINATTHKIFDKETGRYMWASPMVEASRGLLSSSKGRLSNSSNFEEREKYEYVQSEA